MQLRMRGMSFKSLIAYHRNGVRFVGFEIDTEMYEVSNARLEREEVNAFHGYISVRSTSEEDKFRYFKVRRDIEWFYDKLFPKE